MGAARRRERKSSGGREMGKGYGLPAIPLMPLVIFINHYNSDEKMRWELMGAGKKSRKDTERETKKYVIILSVTEKMRNT